MTILGVAMVSMILVILSGFIGGLKHTVQNASGHENWMLMSSGAPDEGSSFIGHDQVDILRVLPQIALNDAHDPLFSMESFAGVNISRERRGKEIIVLRGVTPVAYRVHRNMRIVEGSWPQRGNGEWAVGQKLAVRFPYLKPGATYHYGHRDWRVSGIFSDNDSARESEIWTNLDDLIVERHWTAGACNVIHVVLNPDSGTALEAALKNDGRLKVHSTTEAQYYSEQAKYANALSALGFFVALCLGIGAVFGGMNTMYTAIARRQREIGVLRVLGFSRANILLSMVIESSILGIAGGLVGIVLAALVAWAVGLDSRLMSVGNLFFSYRPSGAGASLGLLAAVTIGVIGGLMPAVRAARIRIIEATRDA